MSLLDKDTLFKSTRRSCMYHVARFAIQEGMNIFSELIDE